MRRTICGTKGVVRRPRFNQPPTRRRLPPVLENWAVFRFERAAADLHHVSERALAEQVIKVRDFAVLLLAANQPLIPQSVVGKRVALDRSTLSERLQTLEEEGLIVRSPHPADTRQHAVEVTANGRWALESAAEKLRRAEDRFLEPLGEEERDELRAALRALEPPAPVLGDLYLLGRRGTERD